MTVSELVILMNCYRGFLPRQRHECPTLDDIADQDDLKRLQEIGLLNKKFKCTSRGEALIDLLISTTQKYV